MYHLHFVTSIWVNAKLTFMISRIFPVWFWHDRVPETEPWISVHSVFPSVYVQVRQQGAWKLHPYNSVTQKLFLIAQFGTSFEFRGLQIYILFLLVIITISTISMVSAVSTLVSKHFFYSFAHYPHHTKSACIVAYLNNTHCPHALPLPDWDQQVSVCHCPP